MKAKTIELAKKWSTKLMTFCAAHSSIPFLIATGVAIGFIKLSTHTTLFSLFPPREAFAAASGVSVPIWFLTHGSLSVLFLGWSNSENAGRIILYGIGSILASLILLVMYGLFLFKL